MQLTTSLHRGLCVLALSALAACGGTKGTAASAAPAKASRTVDATTRMANAARDWARAPATLSPSWPHPVRTGGGLKPTKLAGPGVGGNGFKDYGCIDDNKRPAGWSTRFVRAGATGNGTRGNPHGTIGQAIVAAGDTRTVVCVASGTYVENVDLGMRRNHMLVGGHDSAFTVRNALARPTRTSTPCTPKRRPKW